MQPGDTIQPGQTPSAPPPPPQKEAAEPTWSYRQEGPAPLPQSAAVQNPQSNSANSSGVTWTASEYLAHQKDMSWFVSIGAGSVILSAFIYLVTTELISSLAVLIVVISLAVFGARQPSVLTYKIDNHGVAIGHKFYPFALFKTFSVIDEGAMRSIMLLPLKRFMPAINLYYGPEDEQKIIEALSSALPYEERRQDMVDSLMRKIRF